MDFLIKGLVMMVVVLLGTLLFVSLLAFGLDQLAQLDTDSAPPSAFHATSGASR